MALSSDKIGAVVTCAVCGYTKKPIGRDTPLNWYACDRECKGYAMEPYPSQLWPGESEAEFGYPVGDDGTRRRYA